MPPYDQIFEQLNSLMVRLAVLESQSHTHGETLAEVRTDVKDLSQKVTDLVGQQQGYRDTRAMWTAGISMLIAVLSMALKFIG